MPAGLADSADGETVCSRSGIWPSALPCVSAGPSRRSERGSKGAEKSPVGDSQDRSPLPAYNNSIWVVVRLRAWGSRIVWPNIQLTHESMEQFVIIPTPINSYCGLEKVAFMGTKMERMSWQTFVTTADWTQRSWLYWETFSQCIRCTAQYLASRSGFTT